MKTHAPLTSLFLLLSVGCSNMVEQTAQKIVASHIAGAESAEKQQPVQSSEPLSAPQLSEAALTEDFLQNMEDSVVESQTALVDPDKEVLTRPQIDEVASGSNEFAVVSALMLEYDLATISDADRQKLAELIHQAKLYDQQQRAALAMQGAFIAVSSSLQAIPLVPLAVADLLCRSSDEIERCSRLLNLKNEVELIASHRLQQISREFDSSRRSVTGSECRPNRLIAGQ